ncbi:DNA polymerase III subunit delta [candidate division WOR-1 bacterium RIFOXYA12_FULL_43_27]|uniref:DNA polymerase III subunit delta n=1 Tax=candidate division WOR-1 bacterium RIFOXYC2_FULL_46_14 TaxID=1802587 RepID=A0A1F4U768_UNCSA|nr:MAG: DNA polymerase III subunit delta [candidate division WOR-1 bacterium RIFOXYA12_FULL_43_27]OGC20297.1 MAG: DNA polymerase III subunit delta [candidate division WOR-1 bacterium RIFOXYB2_FULL_46_45]OGC31966.1 MAG: DNA polymerase III subunit delta [candidate division WOR-1 bacterium RIFOXYA2_FULL_46_56]OGC40143.1 MAG: DNA polymerase III subunit delta [candidate division WOR-1 bacterium RIFOXYC2_FULL_46_14]
MINLIIGDEEYLIAEELKRIKEKFKDRSFETLENPSATEIIENLSLPSLFYSSRLIFVYDFDFKNDDESFLFALKNLDPQVELVFIQPHSLDRRRANYKLMGSVKEFKSFGDWDDEKAAQWVIQYARSIGNAINREDSLLLVAISGKNLFALSSEIKKLSAYCGDKKQIDNDAILALASQQDVNVFAFSDALKNKNLGKSLRLLEKMIKNNEEMVPLLGLLFSQFRALFLAKTNRLAAGGYYLKKCLEQSKRFTAAALWGILEKIYASDLLLKKGESPKAVMPLLAEEICRG